MPHNATIESSPTMPFFHACHMECPLLLLPVSDLHYTMPSIIFVLLSMNLRRIGQILHLHPSMALAKDLVSPLESVVSPFLIFLMFTLPLLLVPPIHLLLPPNITHCTILAMLMTLLPLSMITIFLNLFHYPLFSNPSNQIFNYGPISCISLVVPLSSPKLNSFSCTGNSIKMALPILYQQLIHQYLYKTHPLPHHILSLPAITTLPTNSLVSTCPLHYLCLFSTTSSTTKRTKLPTLSRAALSLAVNLIYPILPSFFHLYPMFFR